MTLIEKLAVAAIVVVVVIVVGAQAWSLLRTSQAPEPRLTEAELEELHATPHVEPIGWMGYEIRRPRCVDDGFRWPAGAEPLTPLTDSEPVRVNFHRYLAGGPDYYQEAR